MRAARIAVCVIGFMLLSSVTLIWHVLHRPPAPVDHSVSLHRQATSASYGPNKIPPGGRTLVATQSGHDSGQSPMFSATNNWHIYWSFECAETGTSNSFTATVVDAAGHPTALQAIQKTQSISGFGDQPYTTAGRYRIIIDSPGCTWKITVKDRIL